MSTSHWEKVPLSEIAEVRLGRQRSPKRAVGPNMRPYMRAANVTWNGISLHDVKEMDFTPEEFETYALRHGDLLLSEASGSASEVGKPAVWNDEVPGCCFQNTLIRVRAPEPLVPFLHLHFYKDALTGEFARAARGVGIHHLGAKTLSGWEVHLPPPDEQRRIVETVDSYLTRLDHVTTTLERVRRNLKRYRASVLKAAVEGRLVPTEAKLAQAEGREYEPASVLLKRILVERRRRWEEGELAKMKAAGKTPKNDDWKAKYKEPADPDTTELPSLPVGWCWATLDQLSRLVRNGYSRRPTAAGDVPILRISAVRPMVIDLSDCRWLSGKAEDYASDLAEPGDLLFTRYNGTPSLVGVAALVRASVQPVVHPDKLIKVRFVDPSNVDLAYLELATNTGSSRRFIDGRARTTAGQTGISGHDVKQVPVPLPPRAEQRRISQAVVRFIETEDAVEQYAVKTAAEADRLRRCLLGWVFDFESSRSFALGPTARTEPLRQ